MPLAPEKTQSVLTWSSRAPSAAQRLRQAMGQQRIDRYGVQGIIGHRQLFDQPDAVDHDVGVNSGEKTGQAIHILDVYARDDLFVHTFR